MRQQSANVDLPTPSDWSEADSTASGAWTHYACRLVTPLYGGGVHAGEVDQDMPIRAAGLRGQLRFWWRLACGPFQSSKQMFQREKDLWGGIAGNGPAASRVAVRIDQITGVNIAAAFVYEDDHRAPGKFRMMPAPANWVEPYAVFPARGELSRDRREITKAPHRLARADLAFRLGICLHPDLTVAQREEVDVALRWWASFGGVGARTRRGLGAVRVANLTPVSPETVSEQGGYLSIRAQSENAESAWKTSIGRLRDFRQKPDLGRNPGQQNRPGRSRWPEPDAIRRQTGRHAPTHAPTHPVTDALPRAAFGLPIIFHFKDEDLGEPPQQMLAPQELDRMASPLVLRPYWNGQHWHPAALLLPGWQDALKASVGFGNGNGPYRNAWPDDPAEQARLAKQITPMAGRGNDPLTAFMAYFQED